MKKELIIFKSLVVGLLSIGLISLGIFFDVFLSVLT